MVGLIGERLGWSRTRMEWVNLAVSFGFYVLLLYVLVASGTLEGKCRVALPDGSLMKFDPDNVPNVTEMIVQKKDGLVESGRCWYEVVCEERMFCDFAQQSKRLAPEVQDDFSGVYSNLSSEDLVFKG